MHHLPERNKKILIQKIRYYKDLHFPGKGSGMRLADEVGVTPQAISNWLSGKRLPTATQLYRLAKVFDVSPLELCVGRSKNASSKELDHIETLFSLLNQCENLFSCTANLHIREKKLSEIKHILKMELDGD